MGSLTLRKILLFCVFCTAFAKRPRMIFTEKDKLTVSIPLPHAPVKILIEGEDAVTAVGTKQISKINFQSLQKGPVPVEWGGCDAQSHACNYKLTIIHKRQRSNQIFACGINGKDVACCDMNISEHSVKCTPSDRVNNINEQMRDFIIQEGEASAFVESPDGDDLYITYSGSQDLTKNGIYRFGKHSVRPANRNEEQHYIKLIVSKQERMDDVLQDKIYGFYNEKNQNTDMYSDMWKPFVTQICMMDIGGPKNNLQFTWTSQLNARLFCGDKDQKQHFSELLDIATVEAEHWSDTRVYGLFKNEWGMRAVCMYTIRDIDSVFKNSKFKDSDMDRNRMCVADSTKLRFETLKEIEANSEMENCVEPAEGSGPLLISHQQYSHLTAHDFLDTILFIALHNGTVHKVMHKQTSGDAKSFLIAEYRPFNHSTHIFSLDLNPSTRRLYVSSRTELVQLDVANCQDYGDSCEECILARDPYCGWSEGQCAEVGSLQDTEQGNLTICPSVVSKVNRPEADKESEDAMDQILIPLGSRYFLECPVSSLHANYTWYHDNNPVSCNGAEHQCLLLIPSMAPEQEGRYTCVSKEQDYSRVRAQYQLGLKNSAKSFSPDSMLWLTLIAAVLAQS